MNKTNRMTNPLAKPSPMTRKESIVGQRLNKPANPAAGRLGGELAILERDAVNYTGAVLPDRKIAGVIKMPVLMEFMKRLFATA